MSLILEGIDLPKDESITIHYANRYGEMETIFVDKHDIIQIPKGHGRLIDGDKLKMECYHTMEELVKSTTINISAEALSLLCGFTMIGEAPTILEAEEE